MAPVTPAPRTAVPPKAPPPAGPKPQAAAPSAAQRPSAPPAGDGVDTHRPWAPRYEDARAGKSVLSPNTQGPAVKKLQEELAMAGYDVGATGLYDAKTKAAVASFQTSHGIKAGPQAPLGWADQHTLAAVEKDMAARRAAVAAQPKGSTDRSTVLQLAKSPGFNALTNAERDTLLKTLGATDHPSKEARDNAKRLLLDNGYADETREGQATRLRRFMADGGHLPGNVSPPPGHFAGKAVQHELGPATELQGGWSTQKLKLDGREIEINARGAGKGDVPSVEATAKAIASLPKEDRDRIKSVLVVDDNHNSGADTAAVFNTKEGRVTIFKNPANTDGEKLAGTLSHEVGHGAGEAAFGPDDDPRWKKWEKAMAADGLPPSRYARTNADEDFSETYALYQMTKGTPEQHAAARAKHPERFKILDSL